MRCKNCNGSLSFTNGFYVCDSCGATISLDAFYENIDVYICYTENDLNGRRTKDSIISQEIYQNLQSKKVDTFYSRVSADGLAGNDFEKVSFSALNKAKIIVIVGTSKGNFEILYEKYNCFFTDKIIVPVFSNIDAGQIPKNISKIQALNYDTIGSGVTLINSLLNALGRGNEVNSKDLFDKKSGIKLFAIIACCLCVLLGVFCYILFGTNLILNQGKSSVSSTPEASTTETKVPADNRPDDYEKAIKHIESGNYSEAITILTELPGYRDADKQLQLLYDKYAGYYKSSDGSTLLHLVMDAGYSASVEIKYASAEFTGSSIFVGNTAVFKFGSQTTATLILENSSIVFKEGNTDSNIPDKERSFLLSEKSNKPIDVIDVETIISWVKSPTTIEDVRNMGYEVDLEWEPTHMVCYSWYKIKNTDIQLNTLWGGTEITSIVVPARLIAPEHIGKAGNKFYIGNVLALYESTDFFAGMFIPDSWGECDVVKSDSKVLLISKESFLSAMDDNAFGVPATESSEWKEFFSE